MKLEKLAAKGAALEVFLSEADKRDLLVVSEAMGELMSLLSEAIIPMIWKSSLRPRP